MVQLGRQIPERKGLTMNTSHATVRVTRAGTAVIAGVLALMLAAVTLAISTASAAEGQKVWVCKYVTKPGGDEVLQGGQNPISVSSNSTVGTVFNDAQGRSYVIAVDNGESEPPTCPADPPGPPPTSSSTTSSSSASSSSSTSSATMPSSAPTGGAAPWFGNSALLAVAGLALLALAGALRLGSRRAGATH
jgi:hypothetical protein